MDRYGLYGPATRRGSEYIKKMIAADLLYAYEQGKKDSAGIVRQDQT